MAKPTYLEFITEFPSYNSIGYPEAEVNELLSTVADTYPAIEDLPIELRLRAYKYAFCHEDTLAKQEAMGYSLMVSRIKSRNDEISFVTTKNGYASLLSTRCGTHLYRLFTTNLMQVNVLKPNNCC